MLDMYGACESHMRRYSRFFFFLRVNAKQMFGIEVGDVLPLLNKAPGRQDVWE